MDSSDSSDGDVTGDNVVSRWHCQNPKWRTRQKVWWKKQNFLKMKNEKREPE